MKDIGLNKTGINKLIKEGYDLLKLDTFFTSGPEESRAWTIKKIQLRQELQEQSIQTSKKILSGQRLLHVKTF